MIPDPSNKAPTVSGGDDASRFSPRAPRALTLLMAAKLVTTAREGLCRVRNISATGIQIETIFPLLVGEAVRVELHGLAELESRVVWSRGSLAGLAFVEPVDVERLLQARPRSRLIRTPGRRPPRFQIGAPVAVSGRDLVHEAALVDLSQSGARLRLPFSPRLEERLCLTIGGLPSKSGAVRWVRGEESGLAFYEPLAFEQLAAWLANRHGQEDPGSATAA